jgi:NADPH2 dehydrogenase
MALFKPLQLGRIELSHRIAMAPLTRFRADENHVPILPMVQDYYTQRAAVPGTLLVTEATLISAQGGTYANIPGVYTREQIAAWRQVTDSVHSKGSYIYLQIWALGRTANLDLLRKETGRDDIELVSSSNLALGDKPAPRPLTEAEIEQYIKDFATAAKDAVELAGFDGVEIHGANGYLIDQFTKEVANNRTDRWGGSIENRSRFALEITKAVTDAVGADRTGIRLSPYGDFQGMHIDDPKPQYTYLAQQLAKFKLAYVHLVEARAQGFEIVDTTDSLDFFLDAYNKASPVLLAGGYDAKNTVDAIEARHKRGQDNIVVAFGRWFISNPDLPFKLQKGIEFTPYVRDTFYLPANETGLTDYPFSEEFIAQNPVAVKAKA